MSKNREGVSAFEVVGSYSQSSWKRVPWTCSVIDTMLNICQLGSLLIRLQVLEMLTTYCDIFWKGQSQVTSPYFDQPGERCYPHFGNVQVLIMFFTITLALCSTCWYLKMHWRRVGRESLEKLNVLVLVQPPSGPVLFFFCSYLF